MKRMLPLLVAAYVGFGFGAKPEHSTVDVSTKQNGANTEFTFKINPNKGMALTLDAPWKLSLKNTDGLTFAATDLNKTAMDDKLPGYVVTTTAAPGKAAGKLGYALTAFVCTEDKTQCYREVHQGEVDWKK
jgi:hypothetical protein